LLAIARLVWLLVFACAVFAAYILLSPAGAPAQSAAVATAAPPTAPVDIDPQVASFYRDRGFRPLWAAGTALKPEAGQLMAMLGASAPADLRNAVAAAQSGDPHLLTRADLLLSQAYADYARTHLGPPPAIAMRYIDPGLAPAAPTARFALDAAAASPGLSAHLTAVAQINPVLDGLNRGLAAYRARWSALPQVNLPSHPSPALLHQRLGLAPGADPAAALREFQRVHGLPQTGAADTATVTALNRGARHYEQLILANIERARAIPARPDGRYILVDTASARLWMIENGRIHDAMRVVVGKRAMPTPLMAGMIRYASLNPYWNLPPDLIRKRAGNAARRGPGVITGERLQVLSDWTPQARELAPRQVDWRAVAAGRRFVNLRQRPGPANMMGRIKYMMPNDLGVYLHDTPLRDLLRRADRHESSGCVRLEDAQRLGRWLFEGAVPQASGTPEQRADLPAPVPVYLAYFTALPSRDGVVFQSDVYGRDRVAAPRAAPRRPAAAPRSTPRRNRITPAK
jgi:murein L,D-transpeptidase YcbB/YkuD